MANDDKQGEQRIREIDFDAMSPLQRAAWDRLWRILLAPGPEVITRDSVAEPSADDEQH
jgi:hypothetical protein